MPRGGDGHIDFAWRYRVAPHLSSKPVWKWKLRRACYNADLEVVKRSDVVLLTPDTLRDGRAGRKLLLVCRRPPGEHVSLPTVLPAI